jgi:hypothetical protein
MTVKLLMSVSQEHNFLMGAIPALKNRHLGSLRVFAAVDDVECTGCLICIDVLPRMEYRMLELYNIMYPPKMEDEAGS